MAKTKNMHHEPLIRISKRDGMVWWKSWLVRGAAIVLALLVCAVLIVCITGVNPLEFYASMIKGSFGSARLTAFCTFTRFMSGFVPGRNVTKRSYEPESLHRESKK